MENNIKVGILGMGNMGKAHAASMLKMSGVTITALCSYPSEDATAYAAEQKIESKIFDDAYAMIEEAEMDALYICIPPFAHNGQFEAAAKKGIHIFMEKPIALDVNRGASMVAAAEASGVHTQVGYHMRFGGAVQAFKKLLDSGEAGRPTLYTANYECNSLHTPWWINVDKCGGQVFEQVIHLYDMAMYLMGKPEQVSGYIANLCHQDVDGYTVEDTSVSNIIFENHSLGSISGSNCAVKNQWNARFRVVCEYLTADFKDHNHGVITFTNSESAKVKTMEFETNATFEEDLYFIAVVRGEKPEFASVKEGFLGLQMVSGVVKSSKAQGCAMEIRK